MARRPPSLDYKKHVILLGAGASYSSGYPLANDLRLRLSSRDHFTGFVNEAADGEDVPAETQTLVDSLWGQTAQSINLFRQGGFGSVDEFCRLVARSEKFSRALADMRQLTRFMIGLRNPERKFAGSDYYSFVQSLFEPSDLWSPRSDVVVLSFNYDTYLEYLLCRAYEHRCEIAAVPTHPRVKNALTGGFYLLDEWARTGNNVGEFALLKLHGSIVQVDHSGYTVGHHDLFVSPFSRRIHRLCRYCVDDSKPCVIFPWELFDEDDDHDFTITERFPAICNNSPFPAVFRATWERAQREVQTAAKISFVGLSMHEYMKPGLRRLFHGKKGNFDVVVADTANHPGDTEGHDVVPKINTPAFRVRSFLQKVCSDAQTIRVRAAGSFKQFIYEEMYPVS